MKKYKRRPQIRSVQHVSLIVVKYNEFTSLKRCLLAACYLSTLYTGRIAIFVPASKLSSFHRSRQRARGVAIYPKKK